MPIRKAKLATSEAAPRPARPGARTVGNGTAASSGDACPAARAARGAIQRSKTHGGCALAFGPAERRRPRGVARARARATGSGTRTRRASATPMTPCATRSVRARHRRRHLRPADSQPDPNRAEPDLLRGVGVDRITRRTHHHTVRSQTHRRSSRNAPVRYAACSGAGAFGGSAACVEQTRSASESAAGRERRRSRRHGRRRGAGRTASTSAASGSAPGAAGSGSWRFVLRPGRRCTSTTGSARRTRSASASRACRRTQMRDLPAARA